MNRVSLYYILSQNGGKMMNTEKTFERDERFMSIKETAKLLRISECSMRRLLAQERLPGFYSGRTFLINTDLLWKWVDDPQSPLNTGRKGESR